MATYSANKNWKNIIAPVPSDDHLDEIRLTLQNSLDKERQADLGQFFTPPTVSNMMAGMFSRLPDVVNLIDPGAGVGSLTAAFVVRAISNSPRPQAIKITAYEVDSFLIKGLETTLEVCQKLCRQANILFQYQINQEDFIAASVQTLLGKNSLFAINQPDYNLAILNPPYKKINSDSKTRQMLSSIGLETTNLYSAFMWLVSRLLITDGEMVAIVPRSFCNGTYFRPFRADFLRTMAIKRIHLFGSRDKAFAESDVLQENIIINAQKTNLPRSKTTITYNENPQDGDLVTREINYDQLIQPGDPDLYIRILPGQLEDQISAQMNGLTGSLKGMGVTVSTGRVVDFRARDLLRQTPDTEVIPLIYPANLQNGKVSWPVEDLKKPQYLASSKEVDRLVLPSQYYVLVKRFSSKEEKRRIYAALYNPHIIKVQKVGFENHTNYFHRRYGGLPESLGKGITLFLNSSLVDQYFRQFSGHTQVNASDLQNLKYPSEEQLLALGSKVGDIYPNQDEIDRIVMEELALNEKNGDNTTRNPIKAKKKVKEALSILQMLNVPRAQQNDRSALTLLALTNIQAGTEWENAVENLIGITEMMDFFKENYGINYAPNTRETVRRQTVHQFLQMGLAIANPDDPVRPINSPKTRYIIDPGALKLLRTFNTPTWDGNLREYLRSSESLGRLQMRERPMPMIPVSLPDGERILLSSGGQNELIRQVIEEFCPRYTPGGSVVYVGDAGSKLTDQELLFFADLEIRIDKHGKMPDVVITIPEKKWLVLVEAVTSHGPVDLKRKNELTDLFGGGPYGLVFVTAFLSRKVMHKYLAEIAWETEVWVSEAPSHLIHFNGERFLGPYSD